VKKKLFVGAAVLALVSLIGGMAFAAQNATYQPLELTKDGYDYGPSVLWDGTKWVMYNCGFNPVTNSDGIFRSESPDGLKWSIPAVVLTVGTTGTWDAQHICDPTVLKDVDIGGYSWAMWYTGVAVGSKNKVGLALSHDGKVWVRHSANPVLNCPTTDSNAWGCGQPSVVRVGSTYHMSHAWLPCSPNDRSCRKNQVRNSADGVNWTNLVGEYALPQAAVGPDFMLGLDGKWYSTIIGNLGCGEFASNPQIASEFVVHRSSSMVASSVSQIGCLSYKDTDGRMVAEQGFYRDGSGNEAANPPLGSVRIAFGLAKEGAFHNPSEEIEAAHLYLAPVISSISANNVTKNSAFIRWNTDVPATGEVKVWKSDQQEPSGWTPASENDTTRHELQVKDLASRTKYFYRVQSTAGGGTATSAIRSFTTKK
jgi:hypothetical protein